MFAKRKENGKLKELLCYLKGVIPYRVDESTWDYLPGIYQSCKLYTEFTMVKIQQCNSILDYFIYTHLILSVLSF